MSKADLFPGVEVARRELSHHAPLLVQRGDKSGKVYVFTADDVLPPLDKDDVRWLAGVLTAALDNWPSQG